MKYALEILTSALLDETKARAEAIEYLDGGRPERMNSVSKDIEWNAFVESKRIAEERIPQLSEAINKINSK